MEGNFPFRKDLMDLGPLSVSTLLRIHREQAQITVGQLADHLGLKEVTVSAIERGSCPLPPEIVQPWCQIIGADPLYLTARYFNEIASKFCRRADLPYTVTVSLGVLDDADELSNTL